MTELFFHLFTESINRFNQSMNQSLSPIRCRLQLCISVSTSGWAKSSVTLQCHA